MMTAVLPLISPEKGTQLGFVAQGLMLVVSGVYYPVERPAGVDAVDREDLAGDLCAARQPGADPERRGLAWADVWPLLVIGALLDPDRPRRLPVGERYAKQHGKLKRSG